MKKIKIVHLKKADKSSILTKQRTHGVSLANGLTFYFSNINEAEAFLAELNRFLNYKLFELNEFFIEVFINYQRNWFYFNNSDESRRDESRIQEHLSSFHRSMDLMYSRSGWQNGNQFTFKYFTNLYENIIFIITAIQLLHRSRNNFAELNTLEVFRKRIIVAKTELINFQESDYFKERKYIVEKFDTD